MSSTESVADVLLISGEHTRPGCDSSASSPKRSSAKAMWRAERRCFRKSIARRLMRSTGKACSARRRTAHAGRAAVSRVPRQRGLVICSPDLRALPSTVELQSRLGNVPRNSDVAKIER